MNITQITVFFKRTQSLPGYCNVSSGINVTADLSADDDPGIVEQRLHSELEQSVNEWIDAALEEAGQPARHSTDPRYDLLWWHSANLALIAPHIPPMQRGVLRSLPGKWKFYAGEDEDENWYTNQRLINLKRMATDVGLQYRPEFLTINELREWVNSHLTLTGLWSIVDIYILDPDRIHTDEWEYLGRIAIPGEVYAKVTIDPCLKVEPASMNGSVGISQSDLAEFELPIIKTIDDARTWLQEQILKAHPPDEDDEAIEEYDE